MKKGRGLMTMTVIVLCCLIGSFAAWIVMLHMNGNNQYGMLSDLAQGVISRYPEVEQDFMKELKDSIVGKEADGEKEGSILSGYGYTPQTFTAKYLQKTLPIAYITVFLFLMVLFIFLYLNKRSHQRRISGLVSYLEKANRGDDLPVLTEAEDTYSPLEDELYKTVTQLRHTREAAIRERGALADTLADISHQIKTPVATISLMTQLLEEKYDHTYIQKIRNQSEHLDDLVTVLLTLCRVDAGVLKMDHKAVDVYTMLQLSVDALEGIMTEKGVQVNLPNHSDVSFTGDIEWSMEAFINILKNCAEHTGDGGTISIEYSQNPLYTEIQIQDTGDGIPEKDIPHIFTRFYRGGNTSRGGSGVGLSLAKAIIELENGTISAKNTPGKGACFLIHFYCH